MRIKVLLPERVLLDQEAGKVIAEAEDGFFCLLPRHMDFVSALAPGLLSFTGPDGQEQFLAVDEGILVKCGQQVLVSTRSAVHGPHLGALRQAVEQQFRRLDEREQQTRHALIRLEASFVRRFVSLERRLHG